LSGMIAKIKKRLSNWKGKHMFLASRVNLINLVLLLMPLFYMSIFKILQKIMKEIIRIQRDFIWDSRHDRKNMGKVGNRV